MNLRIAAFIVFLVTAGAALFWWLNPAATPATEPDKTAVAPSPAPVTVKPAASAPKPAVVAPPKAAPKSQVAAPVAAPAPKSAPKVDAQISLDTAVPDLATLLQTGDLVTAFENYTPPDMMAQIPPERISEVEDQLRTLVTDPQVQPRLQIMSQMLDSFKAQTPAYNDTGDRATYQLPNLGAGANAPTFTFQKIDGRWYIPQEGMNQMQRVLGM